MLEHVEIGVAMVLLGTSLLALPRALLSARSALDGDRAASAGVLVAIVLAAALRWAIAPHGIATIFIGYRWTEQCLSLLPLPHYGAGSAALYHATLSVLAHDHATILAVNSVLGVLAVPLAGALAARIWDDRRAGAVAAWLVACVPLFVRNDTSDANNVPVLLFTLGGLVLIEERARTGSAEALWLGTALLALAAIGRPEMPAVALLWCGTMLVARGTRPSRPSAATAAALVLALAVVVPHLLHVQGAIATLSSRQSLPGWTVERVLAIPGILLDLDVLLDPRFFPPPVTLLALGPVVARGTRRAGAVLGIATVLTLVAYFPDLDYANVARVQVPAAVLACLLAARGATLVTARFLEDRRPIALAGLAALVGVSAIPSVRVLWQPTNEATEEQLLREAVARLPARGSYRLVHIAHADRAPLGDLHTHDHFPGYLLQPEEGRAEVVPITEFLERPSEPAYFFQGMRCYARFRRRDEPRPQGENLQPACARLRRERVLEPVFERVVPNHGDVWIDYYGDAPELRVGLYRIGPPIATDAPSR